MTYFSSPEVDGITLIRVLVNFFKSINLSRLDFGLLAVGFFFVSPASFHLKPRVVSVRAVYAGIFPWRSLLGQRFDWLGPKREFLPVPSRASDYRNRGVRAFPCGYGIVFLFLFFMKSNRVWKQQTDKNVPPSVNYGLKRYHGGSWWISDRPTAAYYYNIILYARAGVRKNIITHSSTVHLLLSVRRPVYNRIERWEDLAT